MRRILYIFMAAGVAVLIFAGRVGIAEACGGWFEPSCGDTVLRVQDNQERMEQIVPLPQLPDSLERRNIKQRLELFSKSDKVSYIYLISYGRVMAFYTVKGKITSGQKRLTANQNELDNCGNIVSPGHNFPCASGAVIDAPELDGTYGQSSPYIFFWTTDGTYVQWNGEYMLADQPLQLTTQPELVREVK
mgnify:CR=1 FL=1